MEQEITPGYFSDILVVDDDLPSLRFLSNLLEEQGYQVRSARNGSNALMMIGAEPPDLILLDIQMPDITGFQVCEELKRNPDTLSIPVIFISAGNEVFDKVRSFEIGGVDYIEKPFQKEEILARIRTHLTISKLNRDLIATNSNLRKEIVDRERAELALQASLAALRAQYQGIPVPTYTWKLENDDLILVDYNQAASVITEGKIGEWVGSKAAAFYSDRPDIRKDLFNCVKEQKSIERELAYQFRTTGETKHLAIKYAFVPPDLALVHTEDITERKRAEAQLIEKLNALSALHDISKTITAEHELPAALERICQTITRLYRARMTCLMLKKYDSQELKGFVTYDRIKGAVSYSAAQIRNGNSFIAEELLNQRKPSICTDLQSARLPEPILELMEDAKIRSGLITPLISRGNRLGGLILCKDGKDAMFSQFEMDLAETISRDISAAIENDRLTEKTRLAAVETERQRLARDLHDSVTQSIYSLTLLSSGWESMARQGKLNHPAESFRRLGEVGQQALREMRLLLHQLRPSILEEQGLVKALQQRLDSVESRTNVEAIMVVNGSLEGLPKNIENELFHIIQEALNNSLIHAQAKHVWVSIHAEKSRIELKVADDGKGFNPHEEHAGMGLGTMQERTKSIGGEISIHSESNQGTRVSILVYPTKDESKS